MVAGTYLCSIVSDATRFSNQRFGKTWSGDFSKIVGLHLGVQNVN